MRCVYAASEVAGFAKTGGLADVAASLPRALAERGVESAIIMPLYRCVRQACKDLRDTDLTFDVSIGFRTVTGSIFRATLPQSQVPVFFIGQPEFFDRDDPAQGAGLYQFTAADGKKTDYPDNCERFVFFSRAILEVIRLLGFWPQVLHCNDWQTGLAPVYLREVYHYYHQPSAQARFRSMRTLLTVHNLAYQGLFWHMDMPLTGLPWRLFNFEQLEFYGQMNFLKAGIVFADAITTVSPTYAREIQTPYYGCGLQGVLMQRSRRLHGIVNGVDYATWDPAGDALIAKQYGPDDAPAGKAACKRALQRHMGLPDRPRTPLLGIVTRLVDQKGLDLLLPVAPTMLEQDSQLVVLGQGDSAYEKSLSALSRQFPEKVAVVLAQDEKLAHQIEAGADMFLMPSRFEPCGLNQLYSLKYGTVPVVRATGGLADTVVDATQASLKSGKATGFSFVAYSPEAFLDTVRRALDMYRNQPESWRALMKAGMTQDWSWAHSAAEYEKLYRSLAGTE
ncbi:MAG: glycogen synthase GlgA [Planctomycetes bacterium]|nr:glycogen synthase GlgA [Planctomycetota bacterium]